MAAALALVMALLLAGCGGAGAVGGSSGGVPSGGGVGAPSSSGTSTSPSPMRTTGPAPGKAPAGKPAPCKGAPTAPSAPPSLVLRTSDSLHPVSAAVGSVVEIRLSGGSLWSLNKITPAGGLTPSGAQGALEQGDCVWDFTVAQAGDVTAAFIGSPRCLPDVACPAYAILAKFTIHGA